MWDNGARFAPIFVIALYGFAHYAMVGAPLFDAPHLAAYRKMDCLTMGNKGAALGRAGQVMTCPAAG
jgi:hypothetical protein